MFIYIYTLTLKWVDSTTILLQILHWQVGMTTSWGVQVGIYLDRLYSVDKVSVADYIPHSTSPLTG